MTRPVSQLRPARASDLEDCDDARLLRMVHSLPRDSGLRELACEVLVARYRSLVRSCVQPFRNSPDSQEELMQVGYVGLLKAINNFDPAVGSTLAGYAQPCVIGEIKRHFRGKRSHVHVSRSVPELRLELRAICELPGAEDPRLEQLLDMQAVWTHWGDLPARLQQILLMRFYGNMTQAEIGRHLHISQMHVSRLLAAALSYLREHLAGSSRAAA